MKDTRKHELSKKGWSREDLEKAEEIIEARHHVDKSESNLHMNRVLFWTVFLVMIIGNALVSLLLIPILLVLNKLAADVFVVIIGFAFGMLFNFLIWDIEEHLTKKHHLLAAITIPALAVLNLYGITRIANAINNVFVITIIREDPLITAALYVIAFLTPYLFTLFYKKKIKRY